MKIDNRIWVIITVVVCGALLAGGWFLGAQPQLAAAADADTQRTTVESQNSAISAEVTQLQQDKENESALTAKLAGLKKSIPAGVAGDAFLRELDSMVTSSGVALQSWSLGEPVPYAAPASPAADPAAAGSAATATPSPSPSASASADPAATVATGPAAIAPYTDATITAANLITIPVTISVTGGDEQVTNFLSGIQHGDRLVLLNNVTKTAGEDGAYTLTAQGTMYVLRDPSSVAGGTTSAATGGTTSNG